MTTPMLADRIRDNVAALVGGGRFIEVVYPRAGH